MTTRFYLGTHMVNWLRELDVPMFVSHRRLRKVRRLPRALTGWALDSGGFTELSTYGKWLTTEDEYIAAVNRYEQEIGNLEWAAPMDWMCEPMMLAKTGLTVTDHQERTIESYLRLRDHGPFIPVLQGWLPEDYALHAEMYGQVGIDLEDEPLVGLGSVCRRQDTALLGRVLYELDGLRLHGFGIKTTGIEQYGHRLASADSMAWSYNARRHPPIAGHTHKSCSNCPEWALRWRDRMVDVLEGSELRRQQMELEPEPERKPTLDLIGFFAKGGKA